MREGGTRDEHTASANRDTETRRAQRSTGSLFLGPPAPPFDLPSSPKQRYRSHYRYLDAEGLEAPQTLETLSPFDVALRLIDYGNLESLLAVHIYRPSARGQVPFHPVSMYLLSIYRREHNLSRHETLRIFGIPPMACSCGAAQGLKMTFLPNQGYAISRSNSRPNCTWRSTPSR